MPFDREFLRKAIPTIRVPLADGGYVVLEVNGAVDFGPKIRWPRATSTAPPRRRSASHRNSPRPPAAAYATRQPRMPPAAGFPGSSLADARRR